MENWGPEKEQEIWIEWQKAWNKNYGFKLKKSKIFSIDTPPPYPSGRPWHLAGAAHYAQIDMIARTMRAFGFKVLFPCGIDRNGLPVEIHVEREKKIKMHETPREEFLKLCKEVLDETEAEIVEVLKRIGMSCDFQKCYHTDSAAYRALTQSTFIELWNKGLIYETTRPNNFCLSCGTTIADAEVEHEEKPSLLCWIKFKIKENGKEILVATTRPELLCACQLLLLNPKDERTNELKGKHAEVPLYRKTVPIDVHPSVDPNFGSGIVMSCSYGDSRDVMIFEEFNLAEIKAIDEKGRLTEAAGKLKGLSIEKAREEIVKELENQGLLEKKLRLMHSVPVCSRCKGQVEIIPMSEFYLKQQAWLDSIELIAKKLRFYPERHRRLLLDWVEALKARKADWPISRRRYYGTEIPIWYCTKCGKPHLPKADYKSYWQPWKQKAPFACSCGCKEFKPELRTFDTWMDSSVSPLFVSQFKKNQAFFNKVFPLSLRPQAIDIVSTWLYYTLLRCLQLTGKPAFKRVWIMGYGLDEHGKAMSKSVGNVIDPLPVLKQYGGDALRFWAASATSLGNNFRCSEQKIAAASKFMNKMLNVIDFVARFKEPAKPKKLAALDSWILNEFNELMRKCLKGYKQFNFFIPSIQLRNFLWNLFASHYLELVKPRAYQQDQSACWTLHKILKQYLILFSPILPFICYWAYKKLYNKNINLEKFPKPKLTKPQPFSADELQELNSAIWKAKKSAGLSLKAKLKSVIINEKFKPIVSDLKACHQIEKIEFGKEFKLSL